MVLDNAVEWKTERILSLKSTHTTLLDDFHRYSDCVADGGKQLRSRHHTKQMTRSPEPSRLCTKSLLTVISFWCAFCFSPLRYCRFISVLLQSIRMHVVVAVPCVSRCVYVVEISPFGVWVFYVHSVSCVSVRACEAWRCVCVYACKSAKHGCIMCVFPCIPQQRQQQQQQRTLNKEQWRRRVRGAYETLSLSKRYDRATIQLHLFYRGGATVVLVQWLLYGDSNNTAATTTTTKKKHILF